MHRDGRIQDAVGADLANRPGDRERPCQRQVIRSAANRHPDPTRLHDPRVGQSAPTLAAGETWRDVRDAAVDADALGARGMGYERLDQLALEHLYGVRQLSGGART